MKRCPRVWQNQTKRATAAQKGKGMRAFGGKGGGTRLEGLLVAPLSSLAEIFLVVDFLGLDIGIEMPYHALYGILLGVEKIGDFEHFHYPILFVA